MRDATAFLGNSGPVLRWVWKRGNGTPCLAPPFFKTGENKGFTCNMLYNCKSLPAQLRAAAVSCCGLSPDDAREYSTHGIRAGAATTFVKAQVPEHIIKDRAGLVAVDWLRDWIECHDRPGGPLSSPGVLSRSRTLIELIFFRLASLRSASAPHTHVHARTLGNFGGHGYSYPQSSTYLERAFIVFVACKLRGCPPPGIIGDSRALFGDRKEPYSRLL